MAAEVGTRRPWNGSIDLVPTTIFMDRTAAISLASNEQVSARNKHIDIRIHHVRDLLRDGTIAVKYKTTKDNVADILTKSLPYDDHFKFVQMMGLNARGA